MTNDALTPAQADIERATLNTEAENTSSSDLYAWLSDSGLPSEAAIRLRRLVDVTVEIADQVINIGKIILIKIIEFVKAHPNLAIGIAISAAIGALVSMVPVLGPFLAPIAALLGFFIFAPAGNGLDNAATGQTSKASMGLTAMAQNLIEIAKAFFELFMNIFSTIFDGHVLKGI